MFSGLWLIYISLYYIYICILYNIQIYIMCVLVTQSCPTLCDRMDSSVHGILQDYWSGLPFPSPGDFPNPGSNSSLPHCRRILYRLGHQGSPCILYIELSILYIHTYSQNVGEGNGTLLQYSCLENPMDGGAWWAAVHGVSKSHDWTTSLSLFTFMHWRRKWQPTPVFLPGESQGRGSLVGCHLWGRIESDMTEAT